MLRCVAIINFPEIVPIFNRGALSKLIAGELIYPPNQRVAQFLSRS